MKTDCQQDPWSLLDEELNAWHAAGRCATLWWRDDDAVAAGPSLDRLLETCADTGLLLAVIPAPLQDSLIDSLAGTTAVRVAQHGYAHVNHAPRGMGLGAWELGLHRGEQAVLQELDVGRERLEQAFGERFLPVVVPPWNHIDPALFEPIAARGYSAVSTFGPRAGADLVPGLRCVNGHCDPIRWKTGARFAGELKIIKQLVEHLQQRRCAQVDADEPTGFVTHHIDLDAEGWAFSEKLAASICAHPGASWLPTAEVFGRGL
ncbi:polysaccharide deacetylase family protein [Granulosicoccus antarcticus]|uniref:Polysaccharide deacetylase n=1 Tax=Granulosicoccus antarcticus IMCC3135 TaxID=1192854 RepID=A0A2Z2P0S7_9GAMM|nr:polysaccharide deacetylase family protein [Granulosicoccus antarcticus]ASJ75951.1 hypothetical protein IMCC3135_29505 [Granulosicoccus antarcticus IMCC3135]